MKFKNFWYVAAESRELKNNQVLSRSICDEWLAIFRDETGSVIALQDRCLHRTARLSKGSVKKGQLTCPYHGWTYDGSGTVVRVPSEGKTAGKRCAIRYNAVEQDGFIYIQLEADDSIKPFSMPSYKAPGYTTIRLQNTFENSVTNCAENFLDIPHTTFVHPTIFRNTKSSKMGAKVERLKGHVKVTYLNENSDFGIFSWFLNSKKKEIIHTDEFFMPNVTTVNYWFGKKHFIITSQSVPIDDKKTLVYTDLTYNYGIWNMLAKPIIRWQGQLIIDQDVVILKNQGETIAKYGAQFQNTPADIIHVYIESIQNEIENGRDPRLLANKEGNIEFWV